MPKTGIAMHTFQRERREDLRPGVAARTFLLIALMVVPGIAWPVDADGHYAVRGAGAHSCAVFVEAVESDRAATVVFVNWIDGYLSAHNRHEDDTFDASFLTNSNELAGLLYNLCQVEGGRRVDAALGELLHALAPARVRQQSDPVEIPRENPRVVLRAQTISLAQERLADAGYYEGSIDGVYGPQMASGLRRFQEAEGLPTTGMPDADTLLRLLVGRD